jgi:hypothetical protein
VGPHVETTESGASPLIERLNFIGGINTKVVLDTTNVAVGQELVLHNTGGGFVAQISLANGGFIAGQEDPRWSAHQTVFILPRMQSVRLRFDGTNFTSVDETKSL